MATSLAEGQKYFRLGNFAVSPDHRLLAYSTDFEGDETYTIYVKDLETGELLPDRIANTYYTLEWATDNRTFFYTVLDETKRPYRVYRHELGAASDELVYQEDGRAIHAWRCRRRAAGDSYLSSYASPLTSELRYLEADDPRGEFRVMLPRRQGVEYDASHHGEYFYIRTNDGAKNFRLMRTDVANPSTDNWEEVIPARAGVTIEGVDSFEDHLAIYERERGLGEDLHPRRQRALFPLHRFSGPGLHRRAPQATPSTKPNLLRFSYTSLVTPLSVFDYNVRTRERELKKQYEVRGGYDASQYQSERIFAKAPDGVEVPISTGVSQGI